MRRIDRRTFLTASMGAAGALALGSCTSSDDGARPGGGASAGPPARPTLRLPGGTFGFPSPFGYIAGLGYFRMSFLYDTLLWKDASGELLPWLAQDFTASDDGLTYTFQLRDDVQWHDGRPLTPEDVAFTFGYFAANTFSFLLSVQPQGIAEVRPVGGRSVEFRLERPAVTFLERVAGAVAIAPQHIWSSISDPAKAQDIGLLVGTGPYRLESLSEAEGTLLYTANDDYFLGAPFVERIEMAPVGDQSLAVLGDQLDVGEVSQVGPDALLPFQDEATFGTLTNSGGFAYPLYWNLSRGGALADVAFRRACARAIDRSVLVERIGGAGLPGNPGFLPPEHPFHVDVEQYPFDLDASNQLLDEAGYARGPTGVRLGPDGQPLRFTLVAATENAAIGELVIAALQLVGVEVMPQFLDFIGVVQAVSNGNYDMVITFYPGPSGLSAESDPDYLRTIYSSRVPETAVTVRGYENSELDELLEQQLVEQDEGQRAAILARVQEIIARDLPVLPLYYTTQFLIFRKAAFDDWYYTPGGFASGIEQPYNKHVLITGRQTGVEIQPHQ